MTNFDYYKDSLIEAVDGFNNFQYGIERICGVDGDMTGSELIEFLGEEHVPYKITKSEHTLLSLAKKNYTTIERLPENSLFFHNKDRGSDQYNHCVYIYCAEGVLGCLPEKKTLYIENILFNAEVADDV